MFSGDLKFTEGDLIECLSIGDGKWWIGRHINTNTQGIFPSNFVHCLDIPTVRPGSSMSRTSASSFRYSSPQKSSIDTPITSSDQGLTPDLVGSSNALNKPTRESDSLKHQKSHPMLNSLGSSLSLKKSVSRPPSSMSRTNLDVSSRWDNTADNDSQIDAQDLSRSTPSPLRSAMENVLQSLNAMGKKSFSRANSPLLRLTKSTTTSKETDFIPVPPAHGSTSMTSRSKLDDSTDNSSKPRTSLQPGESPMKSSRDISRKPSMASSVLSPSDYFPQHRRFQSAPAPIPRPVSTLIPLTQVRTTASNVIKPRPQTTERPSTAQSFRKGGGFLKKTFKKLLRRGSSKRKPSLQPTPPVSYPAHNVPQKGVRPASPHTLKSVKDDLKRTKTYTKAEFAAKREEIFNKLSMPVYEPLKDLSECIGNVLADGEPVQFSVGTNIHNMNFSAIDKQIRSIIPQRVQVSPAVLAKNYLAPGQTTALAQMRAVFIYISERITFTNQTLDNDELRTSTQVISEGQGTPFEVALLVKEMLQALDLWCEVIEGYLKSPDDIYYTRDININHAWNVVTFDNEVRLIDASFASPTHPQQALKSSSSNDFYFLMKPNECIFTHVPENPDQQFIMPDLSMPIVMALPWVSSVYFTLGLKLRKFNTSILHLNDLEVLQIEFLAPKDIECVAEVDALSALAPTADVSQCYKYTLTQAFWETPDIRVMRVKAVMPANNRAAVLRIYAGRLGVSSPVRTAPHPMAMSLPFVHHGKNKALEFVTRHPVPHCPSVDLYINSPQCGTLHSGVEYKFNVSAYACQPSTSISNTRLAIQTPTGNIVRLREERSGNGVIFFSLSLTINETGEYRALILAEKIGRWVVYATWQAV